MLVVKDDQRTRLIDDEESNRVASRTGTSSLAHTPTPLQWRPLSIVLVLNAMQPLVFEIVFPFVNQMILEIGVVTEPERVGFYSGLIESIFSCMSFIAILPCSALSDRIGRKPVILVGMLGLAVSVACFGMSKSYLAMVVSRCLGGTLGGTWTCIRIMVGEMTDKSNQGVAFSAYWIAYRGGQIIGLPLGGLLTHPERNSSLFQTHFWYAYPFALPCFVAAGICLCAVIMGYFSLPETLGSKHKIPAEETTYGSMVSSTDIDSASSCPIGAPDIECHPRADTFKYKYKAIMTPSIISLLCSNIVMSLIGETLFAVFPLFSFTPILSGGLGMNEAQIGIQMAIRAVLSIVAMGFFSPLQKRLGAVRVYQLAMWTWPVTTLCFPLLNLLARRSETYDGPVVIGLSICFIVWSISNFAWAASGIMTTDYAPSAATLATIHGVLQMAIVLPQAVAPAFVTSLFAVSIKSGIAGGHLVWVILFIITTAAAIHSMTLRESGTDWRKK